MGSQGIVVMRSELRTVVLLGLDTALLGTAGLLLGLGTAGLGTSLLGLGLGTAQSAILFQKVEGALMGEREMTGVLFHI